MAERLNFKLKPDDAGYYCRHLTFFYTATSSHYNYTNKSHRGYNNFKDYITLSHNMNKRVLIQIHEAATHKNGRQECV